MACCYQRDRRPPADPAGMACQFSVPENGLIDFSGKMWCPFHLPFEHGGAESGKREWDMESNAALGYALIAFVNMAIANGKPVDLTGVGFPPETSFEPYADPSAPLPAVLFDDAHFGGDTDFIEVKFAGPVSFVGAVFEGDADFIVANFDAGVDFSDTVFKGAFDASEAKFRGKADFQGAVFEGPAFFRETQFERTPDFSGATFAQAPVFDHAVTPDGPGVLPKRAGTVT